MASMSQCQCILAMLLLLAVSSSHVMARKINNEASIAERHEQWMARHGRVYVDDEEKNRRLNTFKNNVDYIESSNAAADKPYKLSINAFADLTNEEFRASRNGFTGIHKQRTIKQTPFRYENVTSVPTSVNWRNRGAVTHIKDQGQCGSCWAFSAVGAMEGLHQLTTGTLISLSEQELVSCDIRGEDMGCAGGEMEEAFKFVIQNNGLTSESNYPYTASNGTCNTTLEGSPVAKITGYEVVPANSEDALMKAVANQPVSVSLDAGGLDFQFYKSGVFTGQCGTLLDHGVTAIGYGVTKKGINYWHLKNSWGTIWGDKGFMKLQRGVDAKEGLCGIAMDSSYPVA